MKRPRSLLAMAILCTFGLVAMAVLAQEKAPGVVIIKGNPMGAVKFDHTAHAKAAGDKCDICHHPSRPEMPLQRDNQKCLDCHTRTVKLPMKTTSKLAFHNATAKTGLCIGCHMKEMESGKKPPLKCAECHKKENG